MSICWGGLLFCLLFARRNPLTHAVLSTSTDSREVSTLWGCRGSCSTLIISNLQMMTNSKCQKMSMFSAGSSPAQVFAFRNAEENPVWYPHLHTSKWHSWNIWRQKILLLFLSRTNWEPIICGFYSRLQRWGNLSSKVLNLITHYFWWRKQVDDPTNSISIALSTTRSRVPKNSWKNGFLNCISFWLRCLLHAGFL